MVECEFDTSLSIFPVKIVTERLVFEWVGKTDVSIFEAYELQSSDVFECVLSEMPGEKHQSIKETFDKQEESVKGFQNNESASYWILEKNTGSVVGYCGFGIDWAISEAQFFIWLLPKFQGRGFSTERGEAFLKVLFEEVDVETVRVGAVENNEASRGAIEKYIVSNGGMKEGVFRKYKRIDGELRDIVYYSIVYEEWSK